MKKITTITKWQHGTKYEFQYKSISEAVRCLGVSPQCVWSARYTQHKCKTFEISFETKKNFDLTKFITNELTSNSK